MKQWRCTVCGYVHDGDEPPEMCPICGAPAGDFERFVVAAPAAETETPARWRCLNCSYVHDGGAPPDACPVCGAPPGRFEAAEAPPVRDGGGAAGTVVIIGSGIAGVSAAEAARTRSADTHITLLSSEGCLPYYRLNLTRYLAREIDHASLPIHEEAWYADNGIDLRTGAAIAEILPEKKAISCGDGGEIPYDALVLAMGSHPFVPPIGGVDRDGVVTLRTRGDADRILEETAGGKSVAVIGGGILGLETAGALAQNGTPVTVLESHGHLMPRQLNETGARHLAAHLADIGVTLITEARTQRITGDGASLTVHLDDGRAIDAGLVVLATGVRPNTYLARKAGLEVHRGIVVDNHLRTSDDHIFAAGDVAEHNGILYGAWAASGFQGTIAGLNAAGDRKTFGGLPRANSVKVLGVELFSIGEFIPPDGSYLVRDREGDGTYRRLVFHDGKLVGAILFGDARQGPAIKKAIESGTDFSRALRENADMDELPD